MTTKTLPIAGTLFALLALTACGTPEVPSTATPVETPEATFTLDTATSRIQWSGTMVGVKTHTGTMGFTEGRITTKNGQLAGGDFTANMRHILTTDTSYAPDGAAQGTRAMLLGHLASPDFFAVDSFPSARFKVTSVNGNSATGDLTIRGRTFPAQVKDIAIQQDSTSLHATGNLSFDRQQYGVAWKSSMKDMVLSDQIKLKIDLRGIAN